MKKINETIFDFNSMYMKDAEGWYLWDEIDTDYYDIQKVQTVRQNQLFFVNGFVHSINDEPALILHDGTQKWYKKGKLHRDNDLPAIIHANGDKEWCQENLRHRENKPAVFLNGYQIWYQYGLKHREDGPAIIDNKNEAYWYINDSAYTEESFIKWQLKNNKHPLSNIPQSFTDKKFKL